MLTPEQRTTVAAVVNIQRIILLPLIAGPSAFLAFAVWQGDDGRQNIDANIPLMAAGAAALAIVAALILPQIMSSWHRRGMSHPEARRMLQAGGGNETSWLLGGLQSRAIVRAALLEGAAFFNIIAYQIEGQTFSLAIAVGLLLGIATTIPFRRSTEEWLERELRLQRDAEQLVAR
jgi:hypothetical protein